MVEAFCPFLLGCLLTGIVCFCSLETLAFSSGRQLIYLETTVILLGFLLIFAQMFLE